LQKEKEKCKEFLLQYRTPTFNKAAAGDAKYVDAVARIAQGAETRLQVDLDDVQLSDPELARSIALGSKRYADLFATAVDEMLPEPSRVLGDGSIQDVLQTARISRLDANPDVNAAGADGEQVSQEQLLKYFPAKLMRRYEVRFAPLSSAKPAKLRDISAAHIGKFVSAECIVIRATDVKPLVEVAAYACDVCGYETYQEVVGRSFMPLFDCVSASCQANNARGAVRMQVCGEGKGSERDSGGEIVWMAARHAQPRLKFTLPGSAPFAPPLPAAARQQVCEVPRTAGAGATGPGAGRAHPALRHGRLPQRHDPARRAGRRRGAVGRVLAHAFHGLPVHQGGPDRRHVH